jgi:uncharacterized repeat protein (TIGR01451 family)
MFFTRPETKVIAGILLAILLGVSANLSARPADGTTPAGVIISIRAEASYADDTGKNYNTVSPTVTVTIAKVATVVVTPDDTAASDTTSPHDQIVRTFRICNAGNNADSFTIIQAGVNTPATINALYFDNDASGTVTNGDSQITVGTSATPQLQPGSCAVVLAFVDTKDSPAKSVITINLSARSNAVNAANGQSEDSGTIINAVGLGPQLTDPDNPNLPPVSLINGKSQAVLTIGGTFTSSVAFKNNGDAAARNVAITEPLAQGVEYVPDSGQIDRRSVSTTNLGSIALLDRSVIVRLAQVDPGEVVRVSFHLRVTGNFPAGSGVVSGAVISGDNMPPAKTVDAVVIINPFGLVFAGRAGSSAPIAGARVEVLSDEGGENFLALPANAGYAPNDKNENPFATDGQGHFSFALSPDQIGTQTTTRNYFLKITAQGYLTRMIQMGLRPTEAGLFALTAHALDNQPLASAGGSDLVRSDVSVNDLAALVMNVPLFESAGLQITKSVDHPTAGIGDTITYRIDLHNPTAAAVSDVIVSDRLPASFNYVAGTGRSSLGSANTLSIEPENVDGQILFRVGDLGPGATTHLLYRTRIGVNAHEGDQENVAVATGVFPSGERNQSAPAKAIVKIGGGVFSTRQVVVGRVFVDANGNGKFDEGDKPMPGARLFLNNGQSVVTDSEGLYNFPSVNDGSQVISLDPTTLPPGYTLSDGGSVAGKSWARLLRTPVGGGALLRQNFILTQNRDAKRGDETKAVADKTKSDARSSSAQPSPSVQINSDPVNSAANTSTQKYEVAATESIDPIAPGDIRVLSPAPNAVVMSPALQVDARVAMNWTVRLVVNGKPIADTNIGTSRLDHKNNVATFSFVGIDLRPGANTVRATAISPEGKTGRTVELSCLGRGPAQRLEIVADKSEIHADGRDTTIVRVHALDHWGNPALDNEVTLEASAGKLVSMETAADGAIPAKTTLTPNTLSTNPIASTEKNDKGSSLVIHLVGGEAVAKLIASGSPGEARLRANLGQTEAETKIRLTPEMRSTILVGLADISVGQSIPEANLHGDQGKYRSQLSFFYSGPILKNNMLTLAYDSQRPINRTAGRDRLFQLDPLDRVYPVFGDSSTRYDAAPSNSKLYARLDHNRSYAMFGDFEADMQDLALAGYARKLTGVKVHLENSQSDFVTITGARPDTAFARDVFPAGGLGLLQLSHGNILAGSETVVLEVRDRRNPEILISRETLARSVDYNIDPITGQMLFLRYISTFDFNFNLTQLVVTYEHRADSLSSSVYTARAKKKFGRIGLQLGFAGVMQRQTDAGSFILGGLDGEQRLPHKGVLRFAFARSQGEIVGTGNTFDSNNNVHDGDAYQVELNQPVAFHEGVIHARYSYASAGFFNPFGATVTPGSRRGEISFDLKPRVGSTLHFAFADERNQTATVNNSRVTLSTWWDQTFKERIRLHLGYDRRIFSDELTGHTTDSNLITAGAEVKVTDKLQLGIKREQNLGEADPSYPNQTTLAATYQFNASTKVFLTQRLASAAIMPIADFSNAGAGFASTGSRRESALGIETRFGKYISATGKYQLENGITGADTFAVIGFQNRLPLNQRLSLELGIERGFHLAGNGHSFNGVTTGFGWQPNEDFRAFGRYEFRDRAGTGQLITLGAAGRIREGITVLSRFQLTRSGLEGHNTSSLEGMAALAIRPLNSDRAGLLFSFNHRSMSQSANGSTPLLTRDRIDSISTDGYYQATKNLELYAHLALRFSSNGQADLPFVSTLTYLTQTRAQYRLSRRFDWANEMRLMIQPSSGTQRTVFGSELGFWVIPDLRLGGGYNFTIAGEPSTAQTLPARRGFYFNISSKLSNLFDLFGTSKKGLASSPTSSSDSKKTQQQ